jgi:type I site-specific restriction-modification system R (restriction) subunit
VWRKVCHPTHANRYDVNICCGKEKSSIDWDDVVFEIDLLKSQEINLDYILELIFENNNKVKNKAVLVEDVRRVIRASLATALRRNPSSNFADSLISLYKLTSS